MTPLHIAVKHNLFQQVEFFIEEMEIDINEIKDFMHSHHGHGGSVKGRITPLVLAISRGLFEMAKYLMSK